MKKLMSFAAVAAISLAAQANASVVDLNSGAFANGEILTNQIAGLTVSATSTGGGSANDFAFIFDTENAIGDGDLAAPFDDPSTPVDEGFRPGNVLAIGETCNAGAGTCDVDDNGPGGVINFDFASDVIFNSISLFDFVTDELTIDLFDMDDNLVFSITGPTQNNDTGNAVDDNLFSTLDLGGAVFRSAVFTFDGSGTIGNFDITAVPVPGALPLFFSGVAGLAFARRQRRKA